MELYNNLAIIAARGGSKRVPGKNIRSFHGRPVIVYSIKAALDSGCFRKVMVSTDDRQIADVARQAGADVPFMRSAENSGDMATLAEVCYEVVEKYLEAGRSFDFFCCLLATAPFVSPEMIKDGLDFMIGNNGDSFIPVTRFSYPIWRALRLQNNKINMLQPQYSNSRSQDLEPAFHDSGLFYWIRTDEFIKQKSFFTERTIGFEIAQTACQDIDNEDDWHLAEMKYQQLQHKREYE